MRRLARSLGIVAVFAIIAPLIITALFGALILALGLELVRLMLSLFGLESFGPLLKTAFFILLFFAFVAAVPASILAGIFFAIAALYFGKASLWAALIVTAALAAGVVLLGFFLAPSQNSPLFLPSVDGLRQGASLALFLFIPGALAASLCWLISRPLHRMS
jgi:hypothetical protein